MSTTLWQREEKRQRRQPGDVAHLVFLGRADDHEFFALDIWSKSDNLEAFYSDPNFQAGFAKLFDGAPTLGVVPINRLASMVR